MPELESGVERLRIAVAEGHFATSGTDEVHGAVAKVAEALGAARRVTLPEAARARAAAFMITPRARARPSSRRPQDEGGGLRSDDARPSAGRRGLCRRLVSCGAALPPLVSAPSSGAVPGGRHSTGAGDPVPSAAGSAKKRSSSTASEVPTRPSRRLTQPISFIGLPIATVPVRRPGALPLGVQVIAAPWREADVLCVARALERTESPTEAGY